MRKGTYLARVVGCWLTEPKSGRDPQLAIQFENEFQERLTWYGNLGWTKTGFNRQSFDIDMKTLAALGWDAPAHGYELELLTDASVSPIFDKEAEIVVVEETYEGKTNPKIKYVNDPNKPRPGTERMAPETARVFGTKLREQLARSGAKVEPPAPRAATPGQATNFDDIPFVWLAVLAMAGAAAVLA